MCVQFAKNQPASKGNMVVHCGGKMMYDDMLFRVYGIYFC